MAFVLLAVPAIAGAIYTGIQAKKLVDNTYYHPTSKSKKPVIRKSEPEWSSFKTSVFGSKETYYDKLTGAKTLWPTVVEPLYYFVENREELYRIISYVECCIKTASPASFENFMEYIMTGNIMTASTLVNIQDIYKAVEKIRSIKRLASCSEIKNFVESLHDAASPFRTN